MSACTVVIPLYNRRQKVVRALHSALAQTRGDFEIVVVDDGSTDGGGDAVRAVGDPRIRLVTQANGGECAARNRGVAEARSEWVAFLDSDDEWLPAFLERALTLAEARPGLAAVFTNILSVKHGAPWLTLPFSEPRVLENYFELAVENRGRGMTSSSTLARKSLLQEAGGFPEGVHFSGDVDAWLRLALAGDVGCVPEVLAVYHNETPGAVQVHPQPVYPRPVQTWRRLRAEGGVPRRFEAALSRLESLHLLAYARELARYGSRREALDVLLRECSWRHCPPAPLAKALLRSLGV